MTSFVRRHAEMLRPLRADDAEEVAALFVEAFGESRRLGAEDVRSWLANPEFEPAWLRVLEVDGRVAGYGDIWPKADALDLDVVAPGRWEVFLEWAESEARSRGIPRVRTQVPCGHPFAEVVAARGYVEWRHALTMEIELPDEPPAVTLPAGLASRHYRDADAGLLRAALNEAFAADPLWDEVTESSFREFYLRARGFDPSLWLLAWDRDELAGFSLAYPEHGTDTELGWVGTLGVRPAWRGRGLGEALLRSSFRELHRRGLRRAGLGVDADNVTGALRLYERVGMRAVRRSDNWAKEL